MAASHWYEYGETILKVEDVSLTLGGNLILRDVNLEIRDLGRPGRVTGPGRRPARPLGHRQDAALPHPGRPRRARRRAGADRREAACRCERGMVGVVAQNYPLFEHRTVLGNLLVAGQARRALAAARRATRRMGFLKRFGLEDRAAKYPGPALRRPAPARGDRAAVHVQRALPADGRAVLRPRPDRGRPRVRADPRGGEPARAEHDHRGHPRHHARPSRSPTRSGCSGRDRDEPGKIVPGARDPGHLQPDRARPGLAQGHHHPPEFLELLREILGVPEPVPPRWGSSDGGALRSRRRSRRSRAVTSRSCASGEGRGRRGCWRPRPSASAASPGSSPSTRWRPAGPTPRTGGSTW